MTCKEVERLLTENISRGQDFQVQQHIHRCSVCKKFYHDLDSMSELSHLLGKMDKAPTGFSSSVHQRLAQQPYLGWLHWRPVSSWPDESPVDPGGTIYTER